MINDTFFDISKENTFSNIFDSVGIFFLWWSNARENIMILAAIVAPDQTPVSNGSGVTGCIPGMVTVSDARIRAGNITEMKLVNTIDIENRNTIHEMVLFVPESLLLSILIFLRSSLLYPQLNHTCVASGDFVYHFGS